MIAVGDLTHVVAGSTELMSLVLVGELGLGHALLAIAATGVGNVLGGSMFFAFLAYAQAREELE